VNTEHVPTDGIDHTDGVADETNIMNPKDGVADEAESLGNINRRIAAMFGHVTAKRLALGTGLAVIGGALLYRFWRR
jgi:hypothetical protein